jgi:hypothetical protein
MTDNPEERTLHEIRLRETDLNAGSGTLPVMALPWIRHIVVTGIEQRDSRVRAVHRGFLLRPAPHPHNHPHCDSLRSLSIEFGSDYRTDIIGKVVADASTEL